MKITLTINKGDEATWLYLTEHVLPRLDGKEASLQRGSAPPITSPQPAHHRGEAPPASSVMADKLHPTGKIQA